MRRIQKTQATGGARAAGSRKQMQPAASSSTNWNAATTGPAAPKPDNHGSLLVSFEEVMAANREAMEALRSGDMKRSNQILNDALSAAKRGISTVEKVPTGTRAKAKTKVADASQKTRDAWMLAYSVTLSNLGCQLRRDGKPEAALAALQDARDVETELLGKPSCSTMMNLSAVYLGMGSVEAALPIAKECVAASQGGDAVLFITALHNLAVMLGQQPQQSERGAALPTMLRALREAQSLLGEHHPTTAMLKDKCGMTQPWIAAEEDSGVPAATVETSQATKGRARASSGATKKRRHGGSPKPTPPEGMRLPSAERKAKTTPVKGDTLLKPNGKSQKRGGIRLEPLWQAEGGAFDPDAYRRAKEALGTLDFGMPPPLRIAPTTPPPPESAAPQSENAVHRRDCDEAVAHQRWSDEPEEVAQTECAAPNSVSDAGINSESGCHPQVSLKTKPAPSTQLPEESGGSPLWSVHNHEPVEVRSRDDTNPTQLIRPLRGGSGGAGALPHISPSPRPASAVVITCPSVDLLCASTEDSGVVLDASFHTHSDSPNVQCPHHSDRDKPQDVAAQASPAQLVNLTAGGRPTFLRFAATESSDVGLDSTHLTYQHIRDKLRRVKAAQVTATAGKSQKKDRVCHSATGRSGNSDGELAPLGVRTTAVSSVPEVSATLESSPPSTAPSPAGARTFLGGSSLVVVRNTRKELQRREEDHYRQRRAVQLAEAEEERHFQEALSRIRNRSEERAARAIQVVWGSWWYNVGKPRRTVQLKRAAERERRLEERLAAEALLRRGTRGRVQHSTESKRVAGRVLPVVVVNCGKTWLAKTACLRYLARRHIPHADRQEREVRAAVTRVQAWWRGSLVRRGVVTLRETRSQQTICGPNRHATFAFDREVVPTAELEAADYAALVIQKMYRCYAARRTRELLQVQRCAPAARCIETWYSRVLADQRKRGTDTRSVMRRKAAATAIQRVWRGYQERVRYYMARLRESIDACRRRERGGVSLLQRVARGFRARDTLGRGHAQQIMAEIEMGLRIGSSSANDIEARTAEDGAVTDLAGKQHVFSELVIHRTQYEEECLERAPLIAKIREEERQRYDVALYYEPQAWRERQSWIEAIRLRPSEVERRRADEDLRTLVEWHTVHRHCAATKIQRLFRVWLRHRHDRNRDRGLLMMSRGRYQQQELERRYQRQQRDKELARARALYGNNAENVRVYKEEMQRELAELEATMVDHLPTHLIRDKFARKLDEAVITRDETLVAATYSGDMARLREDPEELKARTGTMCTHPYFTGCPTNEYRRALGLDM